MLSIEEINNLQEDLVKAQTRNLELEEMINMQTKQYNSLLAKYNEVMNIAKVFWNKLNCGKTIKKGLKTINSLSNDIK